MVATPNSLFLQNLFLVRRLVAISSRFRLRQMATPLGMLESQFIYLDVQN